MEGYLSSSTTLSSSRYVKTPLLYSGAYMHTHTHTHMRAWALYVCPWAPYIYIREAGARSIQEATVVVFLSLPIAEDD